MTTNIVNYEQNTVKINIRRMQNNALINFYKMRIKYLRMIPESEIAIKQLKEKIQNLERLNDNLQAKKVLLTL